jgi:nicotinate-nucleotide adenylyltransferase
MTSRPPHPLSGPAWAGRKVGILGGSFNPAHDGHVKMSLIALRRLKLDAVWWLVSPQNPLKSTHGMAQYQDRLQGARDLTAPYPRLLVSDLETRMGTRYTADTLQALKSRFPRTRFVLLFGSDNLIQIPRWQRWPFIFETIPIAVLHREPYSTQARIGKAAHRFAHARLRERDAAGLVGAMPPVWTALNHQPVRLSSTEIRAGRSAHSTEG